MWTPAQSSDQEFWLQWLNKYKSYRFLWDIDEKAHSDRIQRNAAYEDLAEMARAVAPNANIHFVKNRIASFRTCYKRELKKVKAAKANGINYSPQLFYYNSLTFLDPDIDEEADNSIWDNVFSDDENPLSNNSEPRSPASMKNISNAKMNSVPRKEAAKKIKKRYETYLERSDDAEESDETRISSLKSKRPKLDEYDLLGQRLAAHFRKMDSEQSLIAEKIISEVCIYGRLKALTMQTTLNVEKSPEYQQSNYKESSSKEEDIYYQDECG